VLCLPLVANLTWPCYFVLLWVLLTPVFFDLCWLLYWAWLLCDWLLPTLELRVVTGPEFTLWLPVVLLTYFELVLPISDFSPGYFVTCLIVLSLTTLSYLVWPLVSLTYLPQWLCDWCNLVVFGVTLLWLDLCTVWPLLLGPYFVTCDLSCCYWSFGVPGSFVTCVTWLLLGDCELWVVTCAPSFLTWPRFTWLFLL